MSHPPCPFTQQQVFPARASIPEPRAIRRPFFLRDTFDSRSQESPAWSQGTSGAIFSDPAHTTHTDAFSESRCMIFQGAHHHLCRSQVVLLPSASLCPRPARTHFHTRGFLRPVSEKRKCVFLYLFCLGCLWLSSC